MRAFAVLITLAWVIVLVQEWTGLGRWRGLPMGGGRKFEQRENRWIWHLPSRYATHLTEVSASLTEDGRPLFRAASHKEVRLHGSGRFRLHGRLVSFAPWDNSNPNTNGRRYVFHAPRPLNPWLVWGGLAGVIAVHALARHVAPPPPRVLDHPLTDSPRAPGRWRWLPALGFVLLAGSILIRWRLVANDPEHNDGIMMARGLPYSDAAVWLGMADGLSQGHGLAGPGDGQRPLYPVFLAPLLHLGIAPVLAAQWLNIVFGGTAAALWGVLLARLAGPLAGAAAAAFLTVGGMQAKLLPLPMSETAALALLAMALILLWQAAARPGLHAFFWGGVFFGLSNLACPFTLLALPLGGLAAAAGRDGWLPWMRRSAWVALGASVVVVPWLVRQHVVHGMAAISLNGPQMLYAAASPSGHYDTSISLPPTPSGLPDDAATQARKYSERYREAVRRDPARYVRRLGEGLVQWWEKFDTRHPALLLMLGLFGVFHGLGRWWSRGHHGALVAAALSPAIVLAASRLPPAAWAALALVGAFATRDSRRWRLAALAASVVLGCALMNALTSGALANRLWVMSDWLLAGTAVLALSHWTDALTNGRWSLSGSASSPAVPTEHPLPWLGSLSFLQGGWAALSVAFTLAITARGPAPRKPPPTVPPGAEGFARASALARAGLTPSPTVDSRLLWSGVVEIDRKRTRIPAKVACGHWSRAFEPRAETRTVIMASGPGDLPLTLQVPGDARSLPSGPWLAIGLRNRDPRAFLGAEIEMIEILGLWPLPAAAPPGPAAEPTFFPVTATVRHLLRAAETAAAAR